MNLSTIHSKADFIGTLNSKAWDAVHPNIPLVFSNGFVELLIADVVKSIAPALADEKLTKMSFDLSKRMAAQATKMTAESWEPGDELCPPWPWPWPYGVKALSPSHGSWAPIRSHGSGLFRQNKLNWRTSSPGFRAIR